METKHTPGPWSLEYDHSLVMNNHILCGPIGPDGSTREEKIYNNILISCAPELLQKVIELRKYIVDNCKHIDSKMMFESLNVIKKATGHV